jgi:hypothetical protein
VAGEQAASAASARAVQIAEWGRPTHHVGGGLPDPVTDLLGIWRNPHEWSDDELDRTFASLDVLGYPVHWVERRTTNTSRPCRRRSLRPMVEPLRLPELGPVRPAARR